MTADENSRKYFMNLLHDIRSGFISSLCYETVMAARFPGAGNQLLLTNWCSEKTAHLWMPDCPRCRGHNHCFWLKVYALRYQKCVKKLAEKIEKRGYNACPAESIRRFLCLEKDTQGILSADAQNGLHLMLDFLNIWIWFADQVNGTVYIAYGTPLADTDDRAYAFLKDQRLYIGKGSTGYALQRGKGICMPDAVIDPKGFSVFRNIVSYRLSSLAVPVKGREEKKSGNSRIIAYVSLSYPVINAWHPGMKCRSVQNGIPDSPGCPDAELCFYRKFESFLQSGPPALPCGENLCPEDFSSSAGGGYHDLIRYGCEGDAKDRMYEKLSEATRIRGNTAPEPKDILEKLCISTSTGPDALGINYSSLWEYDPEKDRAVQKAGIISPEIVFSTLSKTLVSRNRHRQPQDSGESGYKELPGLDEKKIQRRKIRAGCPDFPEHVIFETVFYGDRIFSDPSDAVKTHFRTISDDLFELIESIANIGIRIYREACFDSRQAVNENHIDLLRQKLNRTLCKIFVRQWWAGDQHNEINDLKNVLNNCSEHLDNLEKSEKDRIFSLMENVFSGNMWEKTGKDAESQLLYVHIWMNLETMCRNNPEKGNYRLNTESKPYRIWGYGEKQDLIAAHLRDHTSFRTSACAFACFSEGEAVEIREGNEVISNRWSGFFSDWYDFFTFADISPDRRHKCGLFYKGSKDNLPAFVAKIKSVAARLLHDQIKPSKIFAYFTDNDFAEFRKDCWLLFHAEKVSPCYHVHIQNKNALDRMKENIRDTVLHKDMEDVVKKISVRLKNRGQEDVCTPLFYWNRYGKSGNPGWVPFFRDKTDDFLTEKLDQSRFAAIGVRSLFGTVFGEPDKKHYILLTGRSLYHPQEPGEYSLFTPDQKDVIQIFSNILQGWLNWQELYEISEIKEIAGESVEIRDIRDLVAKAACFPWPVLITGESGVGKEVVAEAIHRNSGRKGGNFVPVNCGAIPEDLIENELFGHEKGSYTGADFMRIGKFEEAHKGTVFLDEIGEASPKFQTTLLRVLETKKFRRVGAEKEEDTDVRVICATNKPLKELKDDKQFRKDLFYRISALVIDIPPLRDRKEDIPELVNKFIRDFSKELEGFRKRQEDQKDSSAGKKQRDTEKESHMEKKPEPEKLIISDHAVELLRQEDFAGGNVRELRNVLQSAIMMSGKTGGIIQKQDIQKSLRFSKGDFSYEESGKSELLKTLKKDPLAYFRTTNGMKTGHKTEQTGLEEEDLNYLEKAGLEKLLKEEKGSVQHLAKKIGISRPILYERIRKLKIAVNLCKCPAD